MVLVLASPACDVTHLLSFGGTISRLPSVMKTMDSSCSVRIVPTWVPAPTVTAPACGADSQKASSVVAAAGGNSRMPMRSRNRV